MDTDIRVSTESLPWRRKVSCRSSGDSNPGHFDHGPGVLPLSYLAAISTLGRMRRKRRGEKRKPTQRAQGKRECGEDVERHPLLWKMYLDLGQCV